MDLTALVALAQSALVLSVLVVLPVLGAAALVGLLSGGFQAATQIQDAALAHLPRFVVVIGVLLALGPWMGRQIVAFALRAFGAP